MSDFNLIQQKTIQEYRETHKLGYVLTDDAVVARILAEMDSSGVVYKGFESLTSKNIGATQSSADKSVFGYGFDVEDYSLVNISNNADKKAEAPKKEYTKLEFRDAMEFAQEYLLNSATTAHTSLINYKKELGYISHGAVWYGLKNIANLFDTKLDTINVTTLYEAIDEAAKAKAAAEQLADINRVQSGMFEFVFEKTRGISFDVGKVQDFQKKSEEYLQAKAYLDQYELLNKAISELKGLMIRDKQLEHLSRNNLSQSGNQKTFDVRLMEILTEYCGGDEDLKNSLVAEISKDINSKEELEAKYIEVLSRLRDGAKTIYENRLNGKSFEEYHAEYVKSYTETFNGENPEEEVQAWIMSQEQGAQFIKIAGIIAATTLTGGSNLLANTGTALTEKFGPKVAQQIIKFALTMEGTAAGLALDYSNALTSETGLTKERNAEILKNAAHSLPYAIFGAYVSGPFGDKVVNILKGSNSVLPKIMQTAVSKASVGVGFTAEVGMDVIFEAALNDTDFIEIIKGNVQGEVQGRVLNHLMQMVAGGRAHGAAKVAMKNAGLDGYTIKPTNDGKYEVKGPDGKVYIATEADFAEIIGKVIEKEVEANIHPKGMVVEDAALGKNLPFTIEHRKSSGFFNHDEVFFNGQKLASSKSEFLKLIKDSGFEIEDFYTRELCKQLKTPEDFQKASILILGGGSLSSADSQYQYVKDFSDAAIISMLIKHEYASPYSDANAKAALAIKENPLLYSVYEKALTEYSDYKIKDILKYSTPYLKTQENCDAFMDFVANKTVTLGEKLKMAEAGNIPLEKSDVDFYLKICNDREFFDLPKEDQVAIRKCLENKPVTFIKSLIKNFPNPEIKDLVIKFIDDIGIDFLGIIPHNNGIFDKKALEKLLKLNSVGIRFDKGYGKQELEALILKQKDNDFDNFVTTIGKLTENIETTLTLNEALEYCETKNARQFTSAIEIYEEILADPKLANNEALRSQYKVFLCKSVRTYFIDAMKVILSDEKLYNNSDLIENLEQIADSVYYAMNNKNPDYLKDFLEKYLTSYSTNDVIAKNLTAICLNSNHAYLDFVLKGLMVTTDELKVQTYLNLLKLPYVRDYDKDFVTKFIDEFLSDNKYYTNNNIVDVWEVFLIIKEDITTLSLKDKINAYDRIMKLPEDVLNLLRKFPELGNIDSKMAELTLALGQKKDAIIIPQEQQKLFIKDILANNNSTAEDVLKNFNFAQFEKEGLPLKYKRDVFTENIENLIKDLTHKEQAILLEHFGLIKGAVGFDGMPTNKPFNHENASAELKEIAQKIQNEIELFTAKNQIYTGDPTVDNVLNSLIQGLPEFTSIVGKKQHGTHAYSVDIHTLKVLQSAMNNPLYDNLTDSDKTILKIVALCHDFGKRGGVVDEGHATLSAEYCIAILDKFSFPQGMKDRIIDIVDNHHWFEAYNRGWATAEDVAVRCRRPEDFLIYEILAKADFENVNNDFHLGGRSNGAKTQAEFARFMQERMQAIDEALTTMYARSNLVFDTQFVRNGELFPKEIVEIDGEPTELKVLNLNNLENNESLTKYGFSTGVTKDNARFTVHMTSPTLEAMEAVYFLTQKALNQSAWSTSLIKASKNGTYFEKHFGFVFDVDQANISEAYSANTGSGYGKGLDTFQDILFKDNGSERTFVRDQLIKELSKKGVKLNDKEYAQLAKYLITKKYTTQITKDIKIGDQVIKAKDLIDALETSREALFDNEAGGHNEIVSINPRIKGLFAKVESLEDCPVEFLEFAKRYNLPIILMRPDYLNK